MGVAAEEAALDSVTGLEVGQLRAALQWWHPGAVIQSVTAGGAMFQSVAAEVPMLQVWQLRAVLLWWQPWAVLWSMAAEEAVLQRRQPRAVLQQQQLRGWQLHCAEK